MVWIYLSPHLDDAALSCGGMIWEQIQAGTPVQVWTVCAGEPLQGPLSVFAQVLHRRWGITDEGAVAERRREDLRAMGVLGAGIQHLSVPDSIYRRSPQTGDILYPSWDDIINGIDPGDANLVDRLAIDLARLLPPDFTLVVPLTLGNHVDHLLTRVAAERLHKPVRYYLDFPYVRENAAEIPELVPAGYHRVVYPVSNKGLAVWQLAVREYSSQLSTFWASVARMEESIAQHCMQNRGVVLWEPDR